MTTDTNRQDPDWLESLLWTLWPRKEREAEPGLMRQKWWDYRVLHPVQATYVFHDLYVARVRDFIRAHLNDAPATNGRDWHPIKAGDVFQAPPGAVGSRLEAWRRKVLGLIRARQHADADGIPYDLYLQTALAHFYTGAGSYVLARNASPFPVTNLLYGEAVLAEVRQTWLETLKARIQVPRHPRYLVANETSHPDCQDQRRFLLDQLELRSTPAYAAATLVKAGRLTREEGEAASKDPGQFRRSLGA